MPHCLSAFDLDKTLINKNSSFSFGVYLYKKGSVPFFKMLYLGICYFFYKMDIISLSKMQHLIFNAFFKGKSYSNMRELVHEFISKNFDKMLYLPAVQKLLEARKEGHHIIILSSSPSFIVEQFVERFKVTLWKASHYHVENDLFTKIDQIFLGQEKAEYIKELAKEIGIEKERITAYSDSYHDLPFLEAAGNAVAVNPDSTLRIVCKEKQWPII